MNATEFLFNELGKLPWALPLSEECRVAIAQELVATDIASGEMILDSETAVQDVYFIVHGRVTMTVKDGFGNLLITRTGIRGMAFGFFTSALGNEGTLEVQATEHTRLFHLPTTVMLRLSARFEELQLTMFRLATGNVRSIMLSDRVFPRPTIVGILHQSNITRAISQNLFRRLVELKESIFVVGDDDQWRTDPRARFQNWYRDGELIREEEQTNEIHRWGGTGRLMFDVSVEHNLNEVARLFSHAETILWCVHPRDANDAARSIRSLLNIDPGWAKKICVVWLLDADTKLAPTLPELPALSGRDFKVSLHAPTSDEGKLLSQGVERIVRYLRGVRIGLALGGGAARGMAHLGVLKALEDNGLFVDAIAGTSAGAMTGTLYSSGMSPDYSTHCFKKDLQLPWFFRCLPAGGYWYLIYKYRRNRFDGMLRRYLEDARLEQLVIPMHTIAVDLVEGARIVRSTGDAVKSILESINLPPLSLPIVHSGQAIVDGGLLNNVPANVLVSEGCNFVIASTVTASLEKDFMGIRSKGRISKKRFTATMQVMMRSYMIQGYNMNYHGVQPADVVIAPDVTSFDLSEFSRADEMAVIGVRAAEELITRIRLMLNKLDGELFPAL